MDSRLKYKWIIVQIWVTNILSTRLLLAWLNGIYWNYSL